MGIIQYICKKFKFCMFSLWFQMFKNIIISIEQNAQKNMEKYINIAVDFKI